MMQMSKAKKAQVIPFRQDALTEIGINAREETVLFLEALDVRDNTKERYEKGLKKFVSWIEREGIQKPQGADILEFKKHLIEKGYSASTINGDLTSIRQFFSYLQASRKYPNVAASLKGIRQPRGYLREAFTSEQIEKCLASIDRSTLKGKRDFALIQVLFKAGGPRTFELTEANLEDLKPKGNGEAWLLYKGKGHFEKDDRKLVPPRAYDSVFEYLNERKKLKPSSPLFASIGNRNHEGRLSTRTVRQVVKERFRAIGINDPRLSSHSLRHAFVTEGHRVGVSLYALSKAVGHSSIATTQKYQHFFDRDSEAAERILEASLDF
jgi:integrase/recombinase XerD